MIREIQYLRGIAAMMVVWHHALIQVTLNPAITALPQVGGLGVDLFFAISGFIMLVTTWDKPIGPLQFMRNRIQRVVPLYWLATLALVSLAIAAPSLFKSLRWDGEALLKSLFFVPYYSLSFPQDISPVLGPGWSLNYEMFFYAMFALLLLLDRNWRVPVMVAAFTVLIAVGVVVKPHSAPLAVYTNPHLLEFGAGMIFGRLWVMKKHQRKDGGNAVFMALGNASYSIYLTHLFTLGLLRVLWTRIPGTSLVLSITWMAIALIASACAGWACYLLAEKPLINWFSRQRMARRHPAR